MALSLIREQNNTIPRHCRNRIVSACCRSAIPGNCSRGIGRKKRSGFRLTAMANCFTAFFGRGHPRSRSSPNSSFDG
jgi:hypothetical protein